MLHRETSERNGPEPGGAEGAALVLEFITRCAERRRDSRLRDAIKEYRESTNLSDGVHDLIADRREHIEAVTSIELTGRPAEDFTTLFNAATAAPVVVSLIWLRASAGY